LAVYEHHTHPMYVAAVQSRLIQQHTTQTAAGMRLQMHA
jgi:hypothetical protein